MTMNTNEDWLDFVRQWIRDSGETCDAVDLFDIAYFAQAYGAWQSDPDNPRVGRLLARAAFEAESIQSVR